MIIVLGQMDSHVERVLSALKARGAEAMAIDTRDFPLSLAMAFNAERPVVGNLYCRRTQRNIPLSSITAVYWECFTGINVPDGFGADHEFAYHELEVAIRTLFMNLDCHWVNPPAAVHHHQYKVNQLKLVSDLDVQIPETLVTNSPEALLRFLERCVGEVIAKPLIGLGLIHKIATEDLQPDGLMRLSNLPVLFQEYIPGVDIRVHVVGDQLFASEIHSDTINYKTDQATRLVPITLPDVIAEKTRAIAACLNLELAGIDWRRTPEGDYVFFEANPSPKFLIFEDQCQQPITAALVDLLLG